MKNSSLKTSVVEAAAPRHLRVEATMARQQRRSQSPAADGLRRQTLLDCHHHRYRFHFDVFHGARQRFIVLRRGSDLWVTVHLPRILWANTCVLLASSFTLESARRRLFLADASGFRKFWLVTTALGFLFVAGQLIAWRQPCRARRVHR